jgi:prepilin-type N-terminal cleavage/methylation domain-containing protein
MNRGFTLVEVMVAVAISALLVLGVSAATQATVKTADRQKSEAREGEQRARAIDLLRQDWRGRTKIVKPSMTPPAGTRVLMLTTTSDAVASTSRSTRLVAYTVSEKGLSRSEGSMESLLLPGPLALEFWDGAAWRGEPGGAAPALRLVLQKPEETVVLK